MPHETQTHEFKSSWRDDWLKWICGFANAQGGVLEVGKNDDGEVIGVSNARRLLEDIPSKLIATMAIVAEVDLKWDGPHAYIAIKVQPYPNPISYHGKYYIRIGASNHELTGSALQEFLLRKQGRTWDGVPLPGIQVDDLSRAALNDFRRMAVARKRLTQADVDVTDASLVDSLHLTGGEYLTRAAALLFYEDPERWFTGCYVKVGSFRSGADLVYQDEVHGPLMTLTDKVIDLLYTKYLAAVITYEGIYRRETFPVPDDAAREAILNALVHTDYSAGVPIQIKVLPDRIIISNAGRLPDDWTVDRLVGEHPSVPHNPDVARAIFRSGQVEAWGRGITQMLQACAEANVPTPEFTVAGTTFSLTFRFSEAYLKRRYADEGTSVTDASVVVTDVTNDARSDVTTGRVSNAQRLILDQMVTHPTVTAAELVDIVGITHRRVQANIKALKDAGLVTRVGATKNGRWVVHAEVTRG